MNTIFKDMKMVRSTVGILGLILLSHTGLWAGSNGVGTSGAQFLMMGAGARATAMGQAGSAIPQDADSIYWNPSGIASLEKRTVTLMHANFLEGFYYDYAAYAQPLGNIGSVGVGAQYLVSGKINETDSLGKSHGSIRFSDLAATFGYAKRFKMAEEQYVSLGLGAKWIRSRVIETANAGAVDLGILWQQNRKLSFSAGAQNIGSKIKFQSESNNLPFNLKFGTGYQFAVPLKAALDVNFPRDNEPNAAVGAEYTQHVTDKHRIFFRGGYNTTTANDISGVNSISFGMGFAWQGYRLDFAWVPYGRLGNTYRFGLNTSF